MNEREIYKENFEKIVAGLNPEQRTAVETTEGPVLVIAGPGTGKTQILSARIGNILMKGLAEPKNILCLTYTDAGTIAMRKRLLQFIGPEAHNINIYTFHGFCNQVIQENLDYFGMRDLQPITDLEQIDLFRELIDQFDTNHPLKRLKGDTYYESGKLRSLFTLMKRESWSTDYFVEKCQEYLEELPDREEFQYKRAYKGFKRGDLKQADYDKEKEKIEKTIAAAKEFDTFKSLMQKYQRYDYEDMILWVIELFEKHPKILRRYQEQFQYILVDEYQDTNGAQNQILKHLTSFWDTPNVFVVGDDDQSIYRFQGANMSNILDFHHQYADIIQIIVLDKNYRSTQPILDGAQSLIENNEERLVSQIKGLTKELKASHSDLINNKTPINITSYLNPIHEEAAILESLKKYEGDLSKVAIIYRNHSQVENLLKLAAKHHIPVNVKQRVNVLELALIKQVITILTYVEEEHHNPYSQEQLLFKILHFPYFQFSLTDLSLILRYASLNKKEKYRNIINNSALLKEIGIEDIGRFNSFNANIQYWIKEVENFTLQVFFEKILTKGMILDHIMQHDERTWLLQVVTTFFDFIKEQNAQNPSLSLQELLETLEKMQTNNIQLPVNKLLHAEEGVHFITAHSSKGLEFEKVFVLGANKRKWEGKQGAGQYNFKLPDTLSESNKGDVIEEERRLFYVALTRAEKFLHITHSTADQNGKELEPSRFIEEMAISSTEKSIVSLPDEKILHYHYDLLSESEQLQTPLIDHELVTEKLKNFSLSVTSLNKYLKCPLTFYFETMLRIPTARNAYMGFGRAIHYALEKYFNNLKSAKKLALTELLREFSLGMKDSASHFTDQEYQNFTQHGSNVLSGYYDQYHQSWNTETITEYRVKNAQCNGVPINGVFDKVELNGNEVNIIDYKTGNPTTSRAKLKAPDDKNPLGGDYWRQILFYKILVDTDPYQNWQMVSGEIDFVEPGSDQKYKKEKIVFTPEHVDFVKSQIKVAYEGITAQKFDGCNEPDCQWCTFVKENFNSEKIVFSETYLEDA